MERLRFLCIFSTNLDEFFEVRVGGLVERLERPTAFATEPDGLTGMQTLEQISLRVRHLLIEQYQILPLLREQQVAVLRREEWQPGHIEYLKEFFISEILPVLSPIGLDPAHPFPRILNK